MRRKTRANGVGFLSGWGWPAPYFMDYLMDFSSLSVRDCSDRNRSGFPKWVWGGAVAAALLCGIFLLFFFDPRQTSLFPPCPFHWLTGLNCPGCGSLRATHCLLHAEFLKAFRLNPLYVLSLPLVGVLLLRPSWSYKKWLPWTVFCVLVAYWILRNIPFWPFLLLGPN